MGVVYDLISNEYTLFFKPYGAISGIGGHHKIQVKLAAQDKFAGYHLEYKQQYYRPIEGSRETNTVAAFPNSRN
jgi:hypothetical protein